MESPICVIRRLDGRSIILYRKDDGRRIRASFRLVSPQNSHDTSGPVPLDGAIQIVACLSSSSDTRRPLNRSDRQLWGVAPDDGVDVPLPRLHVVLARWQTDIGVPSLLMRVEQSRVSHSLTRTTREAMTLQLRPYRHRHQGADKHHTRRSR